MKIFHSIFDDDINLKTEYEISQKINFESVFKILAFRINDQGNQEYISLYMPNGALSNYLPPKSSENTLSMHNKYIILLGVALGMAHLHSKGIIHRDIKPENILLDDNLYPKICDFDLTRCVQNSGDIGLTNHLMETECGTSLYMAPEITDMNYLEGYNYKIDIFSYSFIFYQLLTFSVINRPKFAYNNLGKFNSYRPKLYEGFNQTMKDFLCRCWSANPANRPKFSQIVDILLTKEFKEFFKVDEKLLSAYLEKFQDKLKDIDQEGINDLTRQVNKDNSRTAMYKLGIIHYNGYGGLPVDKAEAFKFYEMSAKNGNEDGMYNCGKMLYKGDGITENKKKAAEFFRDAAALGHFDAEFEYARMLYEGDGIDKNLPESAIFMEKSAQACNIDAMLIYGKMLLNGEGVEKDIEKAKNFLIHSAR